MIEILKYVPANKNKIIGYVDIEIKKMGIILRRILHIQSGDKRWFALPSFLDETATGNNKYARYFQFKKEAHNTELLGMLPKLVEDFCRENEVPTVKPLEQSISYFDDSECPF